jgi:large subunit ribosomal protein L22
MIESDYKKEMMAKAVGRSLPISTKQSIAISQFIRGKNVQKMKTFLEDVIKQKRAVPFTRFTNGLGHKPGIGPGRYPKKAAKEFLSLLKSAEANAQINGLNTANLVIGMVKSNKASTSWHYGRQRRTQMKRSNIDIILTEQKSEKPNKKEKVKEVSK